MGKLPSTRSNGLLNRVQAVKNFHSQILLSKPENRFRMTYGPEQTEGTGVQPYSRHPIDFSMKDSVKKRDFYGRKTVSTTVQTGSISLTAAEAAQVHAENAAIASGLKK